MQCSGNSIEHEKTSLGELLEARKIIECSATKLAAQRVNGEALVNMEKTLEPLRLSFGKKEVFTEVNYVFHSMIARSSGNNVLFTTLQSIRKIFKKSFDFIELKEADVKKAVNDHQAIYECLKRKDGTQAEQLMLEHLFEYEKRLLNYFTVRTASGNNSTDLRNIPIQFDNQ